ncbi:GDSL-type esterase/lipase family protein [Sporolactobacillus sp. STSJ-5]|uniref:GDSL-type esterase/lipase family protein n=1 Tax=Sporolactobacillus sp. STSJ-5 TaxID=2965076 RepID=UPI0021076094|nr:GDSL-type esterase/lipase family protein [Sporolactobacillus sp. STSJ-5]MCQ2009270.1 GDSL-type esterase/lipase family protein [Sporolactobacillus sp. STSJ-5]
MKKLKIIFTASLVINILFLLLSGILIYKKGGISYITNKITNQPSKTLFPYYYDRKDLFSQLKLSNSDIVFLGDSLTDYNEWSESFNHNSSIVNRGIAGDRIWGVYDRLDEITSGHPKKIFLMIGINDLGNGESISSIVTYYQKIIDTVKKKTPKTDLIIQSNLPVNDRKNTQALPGVKNSDIIKLNEQVKQLTDKKNVTFINLYPLFVKKGEMNPSLTTDGVHLNAKGYTIWENVIRKHVQ